MILYREEGRETELETSMRESHRSAASCSPPTGDMPATKAHALDQNRTRDPSVPKLTLYPLSQTGPGCYIHFLFLFIYEFSGDFYKYCDSNNKNVQHLLLPMFTGILISVLRGISSFNFHIFCESSNSIP